MSLHFGAIKWRRLRTELCQVPPEIWNVLAVSWTSLPHCQRFPHSGTFVAKLRATGMGKESQKGGRWGKVQEGSKQGVLPISPHRKTSLLLELCAWTLFAKGFAH